MRIAITRVRGIRPGDTVFDIPADLPPPPPLEIDFELDRRDPAWDCVKKANGFGFHIAGEFPGLELQFWAIRSE